MPSASELTWIAGPPLRSLALGVTVVHRRLAAWAVAGLVLAAAAVASPPTGVAPGGRPRRERTSQRRGPARAGLRTLVSCSSRSAWSSAPSRSRSRRPPQNLGSTAAAGPLLGIWGGGISRGRPTRHPPRWRDARTARGLSLLLAALAAGHSLLERPPPQPRPVWAHLAVAGAPSRRPTRPSVRDGGGGGARPGPPPRPSRGWAPRSAIGASAGAACAGTLADGAGPVAALVLAGGAGALAALTVALRSCTLDGPRSLAPVGA